MKIAIAGGGVTGLTFMNYLEKAGVSATLFEKKDTFQEKGSGLLLGLNAMKILGDLGLREEVLKRGQVLHKISQEYTNGVRLTEIDTAKMYDETGQHTVCISRPNLHQVLSQNISTQNIELNADICAAKKSGSQIEVMINADKKNNGATMRSDGGFDFLVGADGIFSKTRESLTSQAVLRYSGYTCWRFVIEAPEKFVQNQAWEFVGLGKRFGVFPQGQNKVYCFATLNAPMADNRYLNLSKGDFCKLYEEFPKIVAECLEQLKGDTKANLIQRDIADLKTTTLYAPDLPVIFAGDAGHATTPNMGQGAAMGMEDALVFSQILEKRLSPLEIAKEFDKRRKKRVELIRTQSKYMGKIGQIENRFGAALRNYLMRLLPREAARKRMQSLLLHSSVFSE